MQNRIVSIISLALAANVNAFSPIFGARGFSTALGVTTGVCKWFDTTKGFGFIVPDDGSSDVFVHQTDIQAEGFRSLADGESVEFEVVEDSNGRRKATSVTGPGGSDVQGAPFKPRDDNFY